MLHVYSVTSSHRIIVIDEAGCGDPTDGVEMMSVGLTRSTDSQAVFMMNGLVGLSVACLVMDLGVDSLGKSVSGGSRSATDSTAWRNVIVVENAQQNINSIARYDSLDHFPMVFR